MNSLSEVAPGLLDIQIQIQAVWDAFTTLFTILKGGLSAFQVQVEVIDYGWEFRALKYA